MLAVLVIIAVLTTLSPWIAWPLGALLARQVRPVEQDAPIVALGMW